MLLFAALISGSFSIGHLAAPHIDPSALTTARFVFATLVMILISLLVKGRVPIIREGLWRFPVLGGLMAIYFVLMFVGLQTATPVSTGAVFTLIPLMSAFTGWLFLRDRTSPAVFVSLLVGAIGAIWVIFRADIEAIIRFEIGKGEFIFFFGCVAYAFYTPLIRKLNRGEAIFNFSFMSLVGSTICMLVWNPRALYETDWTDLPLIVWITIAYLSIFTTAVTFFLIQYSAMRLPASKVMAYGYLVPGIIVFYEWSLGHGFVGATLLFGVLVIACSLIMLAWLPDD